MRESGCPDDAGTTSCHDAHRYDGGSEALLACQNEGNGKECDSKRRQDQRYGFAGQGGLLLQSCDAEDETGDDAVHLRGKPLRQFRDGFYGVLPGVLRQFTGRDAAQCGKGFPDIYREEARRLGLSAGECVVFEDSHMGVHGAKDGGFAVVGVYDKQSAKFAKQMQKDCDMYVYSLEEL